MNRNEVGLLVHKLYSGGPDRRVRFSASPQALIRELAENLHFQWSDDDIALSAAVLMHPANLRTIDLLEDLQGASSEMDDVRALSASASRQILWMESGIVMTGLSILFGALVASFGGHAVTTAILGGISFASLITLFLFDPLRQIQRSVADSVQLELIYQAHLTELRHWRAYESRADIDVKPRVLAEIRDATAFSLWLLERYVESKSNTDEPTPSPIDPPYASDFRLPGMKSAVVVETLPMTDEPLPQPNPVVPPKILMDAPTAGAVASAGAHRGKGVVISEKMLDKFPQETITMDPWGPRSRPTDVPEPSPDSQVPFSLATPHHAPTWQRHDPQALAKERSRLDRAIAELASAEDQEQTALRSELERQRREIAERLKQLGADAS